MNSTKQLDSRQSPSSQARNGNSITASREPEYTIKPYYHIQETDEAWGLTAYLPGATKDTINISAEQGQLAIRGRRLWQKPEEWTAIYRETTDAAYELLLEHSNVIAADKIHAELKNGVLRVSLPKAEAIKPRKIALS